VDGLESKLADRARVIRLDVMSSVGRQAAARYGVRGVPMLVVVDDNGQAIYRQAGILRSQPIIDQVESVLVLK
jgi:thioredoxin-related protein